MSDVAEFDKAGEGGLSSAGVIIHETIEQYEKAKNSGKLPNVPCTFEEYNRDHFKANVANQKVDDNVRTEGTSGTDTYQEGNSSSHSRKTKGKTIEVSMKPNADGVLEVTKKSN